MSGVWHGDCDQLVQVTRTRRTVGRVVFIPRSYDHPARYNMAESDVAVNNSAQKWLERNRPPRVKITYDVYTA